MSRSLYFVCMYGYLVAMVAKNVALSPHIITIIITTGS